MIDGQGFYAQRVGSAPKLRAWKYDGWKHGQNNFAEDNEIRDTEYYDGQNIEIQGRASIRLPRRGSREFETISGKTIFNGCGVYKDPKTGVNIMLAQYNGRLYKISTAGVATEIDSGETWDEEAKMRGVMLREFFYFGNAEDYMAKTDGSTITRWNDVTAPTLTSAVLDGSGDENLYAYTVTAVTDTGETEISNEEEVFAGVLASDGDAIDLTWVRKTDVEVIGYNIYKSTNGGTMTLLTFIQQQPSGANMTYTDDGTEAQSLIFEAPTFNTTGGVKGNIFAKYANSLFLAGNDQEPDAVFYGGTGSQWESFSPAYNGGWIKPGRGDGERVTAMIGFEDFLFIFKENSVWKFVFGSDGGPTLTAVIPQYGTSSPDTVWRMEKDIIFLGTDGRYRIIGYEPNQLNVIRTTDISNRIQPSIDALDKTDLDEFFGAFFEQKFILGNGEVAFPYDRRYLAFLGKWTNYNYKRFLVWDKGTGQQKLYGFMDNGEIRQLLVDNTYDDEGDSIESYLRVKRIDGGEDTILKFFFSTKTKLKNPRGTMTFTTYKDGEVFVDDTAVSFPTSGGIGEFMFDEFMFDEGISIETITDAIQILKKTLEFEAYSIYHQLNVTGNQFNHTIVQTMSGLYEYEDVDYERDEILI